MKTAVFTLIVLLFFSPLVFSGEIIQKQLLHQGIIRHYQVYIPTNKTVNRPVIMVFHGGRGSSKNIMEMTGFNGMAELHNALVVYPDGIESRSAYGDKGQHWNDGRIVGVEFDDVGFIDKLIRTLELDYNINSFRIYAVGMSNGGMFTLRLATELGHRFAAVASVVGLMPANLKGKLAKLPLPFLLIAGDQDPLVPFYGGRVRSKISGDVLSAEETVNEFKKQCVNQTQIKVSAMPNLNKSDDSEVELTQIVDKAGCDIRFYHIKNGGHGFPGNAENRGILRKFILGNTNLDFSASEAIMSFFISSSPAVL